MIQAEAILALVQVLKTAESRSDAALTLAWLAHDGI